MFSDVLEMSKKAVTVAFGLWDTRFPMDTITFELIWALELLHETDESDFHRFASQDEKRTRNCGVDDSVPKDFPSICRTIDPVERIDKPG